MKLLDGYNSPETAFVVDDYPCGFKKRCKIRYWLEKASKGKCKGMMRFCSQTCTDVHWNKPKTGIYSDVIFMCQEDNGYISYKAFSAFDPIDKIKNFKAEYENQMTTEQASLLSALEHRIEMISKLKFVIKGSEPERVV